MRLEPERAPGHTVPAPRPPRRGPLADQARDVRDTCSLEDGLEKPVKLDTEFQPRPSTSEVPTVPFRV